MARLRLAKGVEWCLVESKRHHYFTQEGNLPLVEEEADDAPLSASFFEDQYNPTFLADIASQKILPPPFLFNPIFRSRTVSMISAEPYTGKTMLMLSMMLSLDTMSPLIERFLPLTGQRSLFLGQDAPTWDYHAQFLKLFRGLGLSPSVEATIPMPSMMLLNRGMALTDASFLGVIDYVAKEYGITVLFIDTLLEFHPFDENSNREMSRVMRVLKHIRDKYGLTIVFSHHLAKSGGQGMPSANYRARGASVIAGTTDHHLVLSLRERTKDDTFVSVEFAKGRGLSLRDNPLPYFSIHAGLRPDGHETIVLKRAEPSMDEQMLVFLAEGSKTREEIETFLVAKLGLTASQSRSRASRLLTSLRDSGAVKQVEHGKWQAL